jgi:transcriptional regulator with PAS, ATPase and Fis domain
MKTDVRIIAATNKNVEKAVKEGVFREDLFYRLNVLPIYIPSLRERKDDIPVLVKYFFDLHAKKESKTFEPLSKEVIEMLQRYPWPGNIRELENVVERAIILGKEPILKIHDFPENLSQKNFIDERTYNDGKDNDETNGPLSLKDMEYKSMVDALKQCSGNISKAAKILDISRDTLYRRMKKHGIELK